MVKPGGRVVVTGAGAVTAYGCGTGVLWKGLLTTKSALSSLELVGWNGRSKVAGGVKDFHRPEEILFQAAKGMDRHVLFALTAALEACREAALPYPLPDGDAAGVVIGSSRGGETSLLEGWERMRKGKGASPFLLPRALANMAAARVSMFFGARGPSFGLSAACATGGGAIGEAYEIIRRGDAKVVICGGADAPITSLSLAGFESMGVLTSGEDPGTASRPFQRDRDGFAIAEGAGILVLEDEGYARGRGAKVKAVLAGAAFTSDAYHLTRPDPEGRGATLAMERALAKADLLPGDIGYLCAHGTGTLLGDAAEGTAIRRTFGPGADRLPVSSLKSMLGHSLGAAGAVEAVACVMALENDLIPPGINCANSDPDLAWMDLVAEARPLAPGACMTNSFGFGGQNSSLIFTRP